MRYFILGELPNTRHQRYAHLASDRQTVTAITISRPEGTEIERPPAVRWLTSDERDVKIKRYRINETPLVPAHNGEQVRRSTWRRSGKRVMGAA